MTRIMRIFADVNVPVPAIILLREMGYDVLSAAQIAPSDDDAHLLAYAVREDRILITLDTDFGNLVYLRHTPASCGVVLFRISRVPVSEQPRFIVDTLAAGPGWSGHFSVIDERHTRRRALPE